MGNKHLKRKSAGHEYRRYVPKTMRGLVGKAAWIAYFDKTKARIDAEREADALDAKHDALIWRLRNLSDDDRAKIAAMGGIDRAMTPDTADALLYFADIAERDLASIDPNTPPSPAAVKRLKLKKPHDAGKAALQLFNAKQGIEDMRRDVTARTIADADNDGLREDRGLGSLLKFANSDDPNGLKRTRTYLKRLKAHLGRDVDPAAVTQHDVVGWRDAMKTEGKTVANIKQHTAKIGALFSNAVSDGKLPVNPFAGIKVRGKGKTSGQKKRAPRRNELRSFMSKAADQRAPFEIIARCLLYCGARSSEIAGLRVDEIVKVDGVWCYDFNDTHRTLKPGGVRFTPIADAVLPDVLALRKGRPGHAPLFADIPEQVAGPGHWWQGVASKIMIAVRGDDKTLTPHGMRHLWTNLADDNGVDEDVGCYVQGHSMGKTVRAKVYKTRPAIERLKAGVEKVAAVLNKMLE